jgi:predicted nucleic acid-binding protein
MAEEFAYFDTSVLVKRYVDESGSVAARQLLRRYRLLTSVIAPVEAISAMCRRRREGEVTPAALSAIAARLRADQAWWNLVEFDSRVRERAAGLILDAPVRTLDAIHIASALKFAAGSGRRLPFATADLRQREAADRSGLRVLWVA